MRATLVALVLAMILPSVAMTRTTEQQCLTMVIYKEARGTTVTDQQAVGNVTLNRVKSPKWPKTICSVVHQHGQFSWADQVNSISSPKALVEAERIADQLLDGELEDNTDDATYFHEIKVHPRWARKMTVTLETEHHKYLKI